MLDVVIESKNETEKVSLDRNRRIKYIPTQKFGASSSNEIEVLSDIWNAAILDTTTHVEVVYLLSPPGIGKTTLAYHLAEKWDAEIEVIDCRAGLIDLDLLGTMILEKDSTRWVDGPIPSIIRRTNKKKRGILLVNELNVLPPSTQLVFQSLMDRQESVRLIQHGNELVKVDEDAQLIIIATMNPDVLGINELQEAVRDRASTILRFKYPPEKIEAEIVFANLNISEKIRSKVLKKSTDKKLIKDIFSLFAELRRNNVKDRVRFLYTPSIRASIGLFRFLIYSEMSFRDAYEFSVVRKYAVDKEEESVYFSLFDAKFSEESIERIEFLADEFHSLLNLKREKKE